MIFQRIKETILKKKLDRLLPQYGSSRKLSLKKIQSVGILSLNEITVNRDLQKEVEKILEVRNTKMYSLRKFSKIDKFSFKHFTEKEINFKGQFTESSFKAFLNQPFDLLIGFFNTDNIFLESAVSQSKAHFKVGFSEVNAKLYEIDISEKIENITAFTTELKRYLQIIGKL